MQSIALEHVTHKYAEIPVLRDVSLEIEGGEFFTLLGPSGCGKTTLLRIIAGFIQPTSGRLTIDGDDITFLPPERRGMGVVFQNYALFPNMSVKENIAYGLKLQKLSKPEAEKRCAYFLELTDLYEERERRIDQLSGGQQQRVAIARALAVNPRMLLLDEPMSNLDVTLREKMRQELRGIQERTGVTTLFITHDQQEALSISHRIAVLDGGVVQQIDTPKRLYDCPENEFVANFVGASNRLSGEDAAKTGAKDGEFIRPERLTLHREGNGAAVSVEGVRFDGPCYHYSVRGANGVYQATMLNGGAEAFQMGERLWMRLL